MTGLALREKSDHTDWQRTKEQLVSHYLDCLDISGKSLPIVPLVHSFCENHPNYDEVQIVTLVREDAEWDTYLTGRRKAHLINRTAASLVAAELGGRLGVGALAEAQRRLESNPKAISDKDLQGYAKLGMDLNAKVDKDLTEVTGDAKITIQIKDVLIGLPPERAAAVMEHYGRQVASPHAKGEVIDGTCRDSD